jgi:hypothetical protein
VACLATVLCAAVWSAPASAETTHKFIRTLTLPNTELMPIGVDPAGNIIVFVEEDNTIRKFSPNGTPVNFQALGTNVIDGLGTGNCPAVPSDCDETPPSLPEGIGPDSQWFGGGERDIPADMNQSTEGPTAGYIYVEATVEVAPQQWEGHLIAFDSTGVYRGEIDQTQTSPMADPLLVGHDVNVSPGGTIYILHNDGGFSRHVDKFQPLNSDPADDIFVGQVRRNTNGPGLSEGGLEQVAADDYFVYLAKSFGAHPYWSKYDPEGFTLPNGRALPINLSPDSCVCDAAGPWGNGGLNEETGTPFETVEVDPGTHHVFMLDSYTGMIAEWTPDNQKVGQMFGGPEYIHPNAQTTGYQRTMAFDSTGGSTNGRIYVQNGNNKLAVFGPSVVVPDIEELEIDPDHDGGVLTGTVDLAHGPKATVCRVQWGEESSPGSPVEYLNSTACTPAAPFTDEETPIEAVLSGLNTEQAYRVRVMVKTGNGPSLSKALKLRPPAVLDVETKPATGVTRTEATLNGSLHADGLPTEYWFEYGIDTHYRNKTAPASAGSGTSSVDVPPVEIQNLQAGRPYHFRLVAENSLGTTFGPDQSFNAASQPVISGLRATDVAETSATIHARVNPSGFDTEYEFEYGTTPAYGQIVPLGGDELEAGNDPVAISEDLTGLEPGLTYHFRVVATNEWGTATSEDSTFDFFPPSCPNDYVRQVTGAAYLPDCRAYELVSPGNAGGVALLPGNTLVDTNILKSGFPHVRIPDPNPGTASSPARFNFIGAFGAVNGTNPPNSLIDFYTSTRTLEGWETRFWGQRGNEAGFAGGYQCSLDGGVCIDYRLPDLFGIDETDVGSQAPYVWTAEGKFLGRWPTNFNVVKEAEDYIGADRPSPDFSHYVFSSRNIPFTEDGLSKAPGTVYDNDIAEAKLDVASRLAGGEDIPQDSGTNVESIQVPALSNDGSHILMSVVGPSFGNHFYMRVDGSVTYDLLNGKLANFMGMSDDGSHVYFSSREQLTTDDTDFFAFDIFEWSEETQELTRLSQGNGQGNGEGCAAESVFRCSAMPVTPERGEIDDVIASEGDDVYFFSPEQLDPDNPGVFNEKNLYVARGGEVQYVATLSPGTTINRLQISPDGRFAAFLTAAQLTSYDNKGWRQMYTYDAQTGLVTCASCNPSGEPPFVRTPLTPNPFGSSPEAYEKPSANVIASQSGRFMSDDGRVAFTTSDALVEADTNGITDVYEFVSGRPRLITSGTGQKDTWAGNLLFPAEYTGLEAVSHDGIDIYFSTFDTLAPEDENGNFVKFYDARTGGGFAEPSPVLPCVAADECHGDENPAPPATAIGTGAALGNGGNVQPETKQKRKAAKKKAAKKKRAKKKRAKKKRAKRSKKRSER